MSDIVEIRIKQPPVLFKKTQAILSQLESQLGAPVIAYWNGPRGAICGNDVLAFYDLLESLGPQSKVYFFIKSDGGNGQTSLRIINLMRRYAGQIISLVPLECASAATMLAIGTDEIHMGPTAYLSAVDTSLTHDLSPVDRDNDRVSVSLDELKRVVRLWQANSHGDNDNPYQALFEHVHPLVIGAVDRADSLSIMLCTELLSYHISDAALAEGIAKTLNSKYPSHGYPILLHEARDIGLKACELAAPVNSLLLELNRLYSEMGQKATTDFDECRSHSNEILNILETRGAQIFYQNDKDWFYRAEERRWVTMNDNSHWRKIDRLAGKIRNSILHIA